MDEMMKCLLQEEDEMEANMIMAEVNSDSDLQDVEVPDSIEEKLFAQIRVYEAQKAYANLSEEDKEYIRLGKVYERRRKLNKYVALVAILVLAMMFGVTSVGGPEKVFETVKRMMGGREQTRVNSNDERINGVEVVDEVEAYEKIEDVFGFYPVTLDYLPDDMDFQECVISKELQSINMYYEKIGESVIVYQMYPDYRTSSVSNDVEDVLLDEYIKTKDGVNVLLKYYLVEANGNKHWTIEFEYQDVYYFLQIANLSKDEVERIVENLFFA